MVPSALAIPSDAQGGQLLEKFAALSFHGLFLHCHTKLLPKSIESTLKLRLENWVFPWYSISDRLLCPRLLSPRSVVRCRTSSVV